MPPFSWPAGARAAVSLTFDDARPSQLDRGMPVLKSRGVKASFYVSPRNMLDRLADWRAANKDGHEIGNHTMTHPCSANFPWARGNALEDYTLARMEKELTDASGLIAGRIGVAPRTFAYPCGQTFVGRGDGTRSYVPLVARHFAAGRGFFAEIANDPETCDLSLLGSFSMDDLRLPALWELAEGALESGRWLILCGHDVGEAGRQVTRAPDLDEFCRRLADVSARVWTATVAEAADWIIRSRSPAGPR